uniref:Retrotransposon gag domain-containing protein n=1 Tax=Leptobrachium leishanense TaxID=445787 RepID=A0A8C5MN20_9ANUR
MDLAGLANAINVMSRQVSVLTQSVQDIQTNQNQGLPDPPPEGAHSPEPRLPMPEKFSGRRESFRTFVTSCELMFAIQPHTYYLDYVKVHMVIALLTGEAQLWAHNLIRSRHQPLATWDTFLILMEEMYDDPFRENTAQTALKSLRQGRRAAEEYVTEFRRWASETTWNDSALLDQFRYGLNDNLKDEFARIGLPSTLHLLIHQTIQLDRRARERQRERASHQNDIPGMAMRPLRALPPVPTQLALPAPPEEPMQLGASRRLPPEELQRRRENVLCLYCGRPGHQYHVCPIRPVGRRGNHVSHCIYKLTPDPFVTPIPHLSLSVCLQWGEKNVELLAMVDSGASNCFIDFKVAMDHGVPLIEKIKPMSIHIVDGSSLKSGPVTQETAVLSMSVGTLHIEQIQFDLVPTSMFPLILGLPWLRRHNPTIDWETGKFVFSSTTWQKKCLQTTTGVLFSILDEKMVPMNNTTLPAAYQQYADVFNEKEAERLPPHRPYDCPVELLPGAPIPYGHIYPLSEPELRVLHEYIQENLKKGSFNLPPPQRELGYSS